MSLSVINPSFCCLLPFHLDLCCLSESYPNRTVSLVGKMLDWAHLMAGGQFTLLTCLIKQQFIFESINLKQRIVTPKYVS